MHDIFTLQKNSVELPQKAPSTVPRHFLLERSDPNTGADLPDTGSHPNQLDQVESAFAHTLLI